MSSLVIDEEILNWKGEDWCAYRMVNDIGYVHIIIKCRNHDEVDTCSVRDLAWFYRCFS